jgi:signal transduction histidine kinase/ligand-binding sensor domain-containing protein/DNA-binding response OmpR family regulator
MSFGILNSQNSINFEYLTTENGLSQNDINCIYQDSLGYMWFGTHDGLNRYDGYNFTVYNLEISNPKSINSNLIKAITGDGSGNLWIGTTGSGLSYFDKDTENFVHYTNEKGNPNSLSDNYISAVFKDKRNRLYVGHSKGIDRIDLSENENGLTKFKSVRIESKGFKSVSNRFVIHSFYESKDDNVFVCTSFGLMKLSVNNKGEEYFKWCNKEFGLPNAPIKNMVEDSFGRKIFSAIKGLYVHSFDENNDEKGKVRILGRYMSFNYVVVDRGSIWGATNKGLVHFVNGEQLKINHRYRREEGESSKSLSHNQLRSLFCDRTGVIWIGTYGGGINKFDPMIKKIKHIKSTRSSTSLKGNKIRSIFEDSNGTLWFGSDGEGMNQRIDKGNSYSNFVKYDFLSKCYAIEEIKQGDKKVLLFGAESKSGLKQLDITVPKELYSKKDFVAIKDVKSSAFSLLKDSNENVWIGTYTLGVYRWLATDKPGVYIKDVLFHDSDAKNSLANNIIRDIHEDKHGNIWFATGEGLSKLPVDEINSKNPQFINYKNIANDLTSLSHDYVLTIFENLDGELWIGTFGGGLNKFVPSENGGKGTFLRFSKNDGLPNNVIKGILEDNRKNLWLATNKGLSKFNTKTKEFKNYDVNDGLQSNEFSELACIKRKNGEFLFGGVNGFNAFYPTRIRSNKEASETVFRSFSIFKKNIGIGEEVNGRVILEKTINDVEGVTLKYEENSFSFEFAALHYSAPVKNQYAYKLEGFNNNWIYTNSDDRFATYTNLAPGEYLLKVASSNNDGIWDETPAELKIIITPPIWRTNWAKALYILIIVGMLFAFRRFTVISTSKKFDLDLKILEKVKNEELQKMKLEFFTNISHEFRTPLTLIKGPLDYLLKKGDAASSKSVKEKYNLMKKNTDYLLRLIDQLLDFRKMDKGRMDLSVYNNDIVKFIKELGEPFQFLSVKKKVDFSVKSSKETITTWFDSNAVEKILNNLLSNAFKFTPEEGEVKIFIFDGEDFEDEGRIKTEKLNKSDYIIVKVKDSGPGIPAHRINHVFERFYVETDKLKLNTKGTGIGLSYTKNLVELHKGVIDVKSDTEDGTTFYVWLPKNKEIYKNLEDVHLNEITETDAYISQTEAESHALGVIDDIVDKNISRSRSKLPVLLIVDDNKDIRSFVKQVLGEEYYIYEAENGAEGFETANKVIPNIIITDIMMPIMDGVELCKKLKEAQETSHIPVVMLTAKRTQEWEIEGLKTGADGYIRKPFDVELLDLKLKNILNDRKKLRKRFNREITLQPKDITVTSTDEKFLNKAIEIVEDHMTDSEFSVELLVKEMSLSRSNLYLKLKELTGLSSSEFIRNIRLKRAMQLMQKSDYSVKEIMYMTGFSTGSYFSKCFKKQFGVIPSKYVRGIKKEDEEKEEDK